MSQIIAQFSCRKQNSNTYVLSFENGLYKFRKFWFNVANPSVTQEEIHSSPAIDDVIGAFFISADNALDTTKDYNFDVTDEQRQTIRTAVSDAKSYAEVAA